LDTLTYTHSIFSQPWWLDAVAPDRWGEVVIEKGGSVVARLPYVIRKKSFGRTFLEMPKLTKTLGPWLRPYPGKYTNRLSEEKELMTELIARLPPFASFLQNFDYTITNWLPFYWQGFSQTTRYTYVLEDLSNIDQVWNGLRENIKTDIRKSEKIVSIRNDLSFEDFMTLNRKVFSRQGKDAWYSSEFASRLDAACFANGRRKIFFAEDGKGQLHAAVYIVWDEHSAYYLMGGGDPELRNSGATSLCMWEAIKFAATVTQKFDFEGSMIEPVERFFRAFGARQIPFFQISKINSRVLKVANDIRSWF
jgi:hypothetical protein